MCLRAGPRLTVKSIQWQRRAEGYTVSNFEVEPANNTEDTHNYFVGTTQGGVLVHNAEYPRPTWATPGNPTRFASWIKQIETSRAVLSAEQADEIVREARSYGMAIRALPEDLAGAHSASNPWTGTPHIHIGDQEFHIPVPTGYQLPP